MTVWRAITYFGRKADRSTPVPAGQSATAGPAERDPGHTSRALSPPSSQGGPAESSGRVGSKCDGPFVSPLDVQLAVGHNVHRNGLGAGERASAQASLKRSGMAARARAWDIAAREGRLHEERTR